MLDVRTVPPGRAGRRRLHELLDTASRCADLLGRKLRLLRREQGRLRELAERTRQVWEYRAAEATLWYDRAAELCGEDELALSTVEGASVEIGWETLMGIRYPDTVRCHPPVDDPTGHCPASVALVQARQAYRAALEAATAYAGAAAAYRAIDAEVAQTRRTVRGITNGRVPRLERTLHAATARIDEAERAELVRLRWAADRAGSNAHGPAPP
jgi:V/A-type H+-transporting ATPase subunit D